jgi:uncharacterized membrane protein
MRRDLHEEDSIFGEGATVHRKSMVIAACAALVLLGMPASPAGAATVLGGRYVGCYGINKKGNYNRVRATVVGLINAEHRVAGRGTLGVSASCQRVNSLPVSEMHVYKVQLRRSDGYVFATAGPVGTRTKAKIGATTGFASVRCGVAMRVWEDIGYRYYDGSRVRPYWIHGPYFYRC